MQRVRLEVEAACTGEGAASIRLDEIRELNALIQTETGPQKLSELINELTARLDELDREGHTESER